MILFSFKVKSYLKINKLKKQKKKIIQIYIPIKFYHLDKVDIISKL